MDLVILTVISAIAHRGACAVVFYEGTSEAVLNFPMMFRRPFVRDMIRVYMFAAIPLGCLNGFLLYGGVGLVVCGFGTWLGTLLANLVLRFNPASQLFWFGTANVIWTIINLANA